MCTEDFILFSLSPEYNDTYTIQKRFLLLAPPMNSYRIKQRDMLDDENQEMFVHFDDKYILYSKYFDEQNKEFTCKGRLTFEIYLLNNQVVQTVDMPVHQNSFYPVFCQSGEFFVIPIYSDPLTENPGQIVDFEKLLSSELETYMNLYRIKKSENYVRSTTDLQANPAVSMRKKDDNEVIKIELVKRINIPTKYALKQNGTRQNVFELPNEIDDDIQRIHVDNKGNVFLINEEFNLFLINEIDAWDSLDSIISQTKTTFDRLDFFKFGQNNLVFKYNEDIYTAKYTDSKLTKSKLLKHKALDIS